MKLCFFNRSFYPDLTATGQLLTELASDLTRDHAHQVTVVAGPALDGKYEQDPTNGGGWGLFRRESINGVEIYRTRTTAFGKGHFLGRFTDYLSHFFAACYAGLKVPKADIVVALTDPPIIGLAALLAARRARAKFVFVSQDVFPEVGALLEDFQSSTLDWILQRIHRLLLHRADRVVALGETMRKRLVEQKGADPSRTRVIHNWADCSAIRPGSKDNFFSVSNGLSRSFVVMHSGNIGLSQNIEVLIDAAERLQGRPDIEVVIVGDGVKRQALERRVKNKGLSNVRFLPFQPKEGLHDAFATADVFVVSLMPGLAGVIVPSKLYGILAAGRPYVAAVDDDSEVALLTRRHRCGLIAAPGDGEELSEKILCLYRDRTLARQLGENARRVALCFDRNKQVRAYQELFQGLRCEQPSLGPMSPLKRGFDVALAFAGLAVSAPLWALIACAIKLEDGGPVFFHQQRVGRGGRLFTSWKFRSMTHGTEREAVPLQARDKDPRVTRVGRVLRATAMDELPQLWNILRGDMSFVGPRALAQREIETKGEGRSVPLHEIPGFTRRHSVPPGLTGIAQIFAPRDIPRRKKFRYDLLYVKRGSFWLDLRLIALSFWITLRGKWETRAKKL